MKSDLGQHVIVIGCGIVGACTAHALLENGWRVTLVDPGVPGGVQAASFGNGAFISPASIVPMSTPGLWRRVPAYLFSSESPFTIRWSCLPRLLPWLFRFILAGSTVRKVEQTARSLNLLLKDCVLHHQALAKRCGCEHFIRKDGLLYAYPSRHSFESDTLAWRLRRENGVKWRELEGEDLRSFEPALDSRYLFAALVEDGGNCTDPGGYVSSLAASAVAFGANLVKARAIGFNFSESALKSVRTDKGDLLCDKAVVAAGVYSPPLASTAGDTVPLESERGYHVEIEAPGSTLKIPIMPSDGRMANCVVSGNLRAAGQVELASLEAGPNWRRADLLLRRLIETYPTVGLGRKDLKIKRWMGHRPSTPDGLPVIGFSSTSRDIVYAFGHGHIGLAAAPRTAKAVSDLLVGRRSDLDVVSFSAARFKRERFYSLRRWRKAN
ncbi:NAD(P)/FAD-dependent oxidoreductase [Agrobacterium pusense]|uniref:NAD(P)/FAD-dependent oxidoreductase n=1 Tax=Agrobacterium pusense TaxID=648995 RepID=UPI0035A6F04C